MNRSLLRRGYFLIALTLACFALPPAARAVSPPPDGGYPVNNTAEGDFALFSLTTGVGNTAIGNSALGATTTGRSNTATGNFALQFNRTGNDNTAAGVVALANNTIGNSNTATGVQAPRDNTIGNSNTATGVAALLSNTTASFNTANGFAALKSNTTGDDNTATGFQALINNTTGSLNTANGVNALLTNSTGGNNTANGVAALFNNNSGSNNTANGVDALASNATGNSNTATGSFALFSNTSGSNNIALGLNAGIKLTTGSNNIDIGNDGVAGEANKIRIGTKGTQKNTFIAGISGVTVAGGVGVIIDTNGRLGTVVSSERFKDAIKPMDRASEAILALKPVTFHYKHELDPDGIAQFGLVAEQVEKVNPDLVARDERGKPYTVRYEAVNAMLLNEFLKTHRKVEEQEATIIQLKAADTKHEAAIAQQQKDFKATIAQQQKEIKALTASLRDQASQIQKVSAQLEVTKAAPQIARNNQ